jgi:hypothetical protein
MKLIKMTIIITILSILAFLYYYFFKRTETYPYQVVKKFEHFEIRKYEAALFTSVSLDAMDYKSTSTKGFRILAGYIFGDNETEEKIAMTTPVMMQMGENTTMQFLVPSKYAIDELPKAKNSSIQILEVPERTVAVIRYSGWNDDVKMEKYRTKLAQELAKMKILHKGGFTFMGYNAPFDFINRRNEIMVELK